MCKSHTNYAEGSQSDTQTGLINLWFTTEGFEWIFIGAGAMLVLWCLLQGHSCLKKRKAYRTLQATNLALSNHRLGQNLINPPPQAEMTSILTAIPQGYAMSAPFSPPSVPNPGPMLPAAEPSHRMMSLTYDKPFTSWSGMVQSHIEDWQKRIDTIHQKYN